MIKILQVGIEGPINVTAAAWVIISALATVIVSLVYYIARGHKATLLASRADKEESIKVIEKYNGIIQELMREHQKISDDIIHKNTLMGERNTDIMDSVQKTLKEFSDSIKTHSKNEVEAFNEMKKTIDKSMENETAIERIEKIVSDFKKEYPK